MDSLIDPNRKPAMLEQLRKDADMEMNRASQTPDCLLYTSDAADERSSVDLGGRRIIKKKSTCIDTGEAEDAHRLVCDRSAAGHCDGTDVECFLTC